MGKRIVKVKEYQTELVNGNKGNIYIPADQDLHEMISEREFLVDYYTEQVTRSSAVIKWEFVGYKETIVGE